MSFKKFEWQTDQEKLDAQWKKEWTEKSTAKKTFEICLTILVISLPWIIPFLLLALGGPWKRTDATPFFLFWSPLVIYALIMAFGMHSIENDRIRIKEEKKKRGYY